MCYKIWCFLVVFGNFEKNPYDNSDREQLSWARLKSDWSVQNHASWYKHRLKIWFWIKILLNLQISSTYLPPSGLNYPPATSGGHQEVSDLPQEAIAGQKTQVEVVQVLQNCGVSTKQEAKSTSHGGPSRPMPRSRGRPSTWWVRSTSTQKQLFLLPKPDWILHKV